MASTWMIIQRSISTTSTCFGKRNVRKFLLYNKRGSRLFKERQRTNPDPAVPIDKRGVKDTGYMCGDKWVNIPEMIPELIVPSLEGFTLKPYVSYAVKEINEPKFTAQDLFNAVYAKKIIHDFKTGQLKPDGEPLKPNEYEELTPHEAKDRAGKTGSDIFSVQRNEVPK